MMEKNRKTTFSIEVLTSCVYNHQQYIRRQTTQSFCNYVHREHEYTKTLKNIYYLGT